MSGLAVAAPAVALLVTLAACGSTSEPAAAPSPDPTSATASPAPAPETESESAPAPPPPATAPVDPCALVDEATWRRGLRLYAEDARLIRTLDVADSTQRIGVQCEVDIGRFPHPGVIVWGYVLNEVDPYDPSEEYDGVPFTGEGFDAADVARGWREKSGSGAYALVHDQLVYAQIIDQGPVGKKQRRPKGLPRAIMADLVTNAVPGMDDFAFHLPEQCPAVDSAEVTRLIGTVVVAGGYADYGNAECEYVGEQVESRLRLWARSHTQDYWDIDAGLTSSLSSGLGSGLGASDLPEPWFDEAPGVRTRIHESPGRLTLRFSDPRTLAYIGIEVQRAKGRVKRRPVSALGVDWRDTWLARLPERRRTD